MGSIEVNILGQKYTIRGDQDEDYIAALANYLNSRIDEIYESAPSIPPLKAAILSALGVTDDLFKLKEEVRIINKKQEQLAKDGLDNSNYKELKSDYTKLKKEHDKVLNRLEKIKDYDDVKSELKHLQAENERMSKDMIGVGDYNQIKDELDRLKQGYDILTKELEATTDALNNILG